MVEGWLRNPDLKWCAVFRRNVKIGFDQGKVKMFFASKNDDGNWKYEKMEKWPFS